MKASVAIAGQMHTGYASRGLSVCTGIPLASYTKTETDGADWGEPLAGRKQIHPGGMLDKCCSSRKALLIARPSSHGVGSLRNG